MVRPRNEKGPYTVVIKLGTSSIIDEHTHQPLISTLSSIVETCVKLRLNGHKVVLVSSGAIGVGMRRMNLPGKPKALSGRQALAAIGQGRLIALWDSLFSHLDQPIAQVLLTRGDISDRSRYLNAVDTFNELFTLGVIPIVNENDTVSVSEIRFGDNDTLSAITASMVHADYLFLLTDVDALYTSNPRKDPDAKAIDIVDSVAEIRKVVSTATLGSKLGTGGMETKLIAAEIATAAGVDTIVTSSKRPENVFKIIAYYSQLSKNGSTPTHLSDVSTPVSTLASTMTGSEHTVTKLTSTSEDNDNLSLSIPRPPHTLFRASATPMRDAKSWTAYTLVPAGSVIIDAGAYRVLSRRDSGGRLLAVGIVGVSGVFASGQAVRIVVRKQADHGHDSRSEHYPHSPLKKRATSGEFVGFMAAEPGVGTPLTPTPSLWQNHPPAVSFSSLGPLSCPGPTDEANPIQNVKETGVQFKGVVNPEEGWVEVEVGRGLANYNSAEIERIKGMKSSNIMQALGYVDSEYIVENITIHIAP